MGTMQSMHARTLVPRLGGRVVQGSHHDTLESDAWRCAISPRHFVTPGPITGGDSIHVAHGRTPRVGPGGLVMPDAHGGTAGRDVEGRTMRQPHLPATRAPTAMPR